MDNQDKTYSFVINYDGGTFISQINAKSIEESISRWGEIELPIIVKLAKIDSNTIREIKSKLLKEEPILIQNLKRIWCNDFGLKYNGYFSMTIIQSDIN